MACPVADLDRAGLEDGYGMGRRITPWRATQGRPGIGAEQLDLWRFRIEPAAQELSRVRAFLSDEERARADRLLDPLRAARFVSGRGGLRQILACYLKVPPEQLDFVYGEHGKPQLSNPVDPPLFFNLAHAGDWALLAVSSSSEVGVDLERVDPLLDFQKIAARVFPEDNDLTWQSCPAHRRRRLFYRRWTRHEARLKAAGCGFSGVADPDPTRGWRVCSFVVARGYLGAVAVAGNVREIRRWTV